LLAAKYILNHWRHFIEGGEIHIRMDHESLRVYRTKRPMTKRLGKFMNEIEHYHPMIEYRPGRLQVVPDALSCMPGAREDATQRIQTVSPSWRLMRQMMRGQRHQVHQVRQRRGHWPHLLPVANHQVAMVTRKHWSIEEPGGKPNIRHYLVYISRVRRYLQAKKKKKKRR